MRRSVLTLAVLGLAWCAWSHRAAASPAECQPTVRVTGDPDVVERIRDTLAARGLGADETAACPGLRAHVERRHDMLQVEVIDRYGRRSTREVRDAGTAVVLIESWARPEVVTGEALADLPGASGASVRDEPAIVTHASAVVPAVTGVALTAGMLRDGDAGGWFDGAVTGCRSLGPVCLGGRASLARDARFGDMSFHPRTTVGLAAHVERAVFLGRIAVVPAVGVGAAWNRVGALGVHMDQQLDTYDLRVLGAVSLRYAVSARWSLEGGFVGEGAIGADPTMPSSYLHAMAGVRVGAP